MATSVSKLIQILITRLYPVPRAIIAGHYWEYRFWHAVDPRKAFYSWLGLVRCV